MKRRAKPKRRNWILTLVLFLLLALAVGVLGWCRWVYWQIESYAGQDQAAQVAQAAQGGQSIQAVRSDAIGVFGAAEYDGRPSPVYRARRQRRCAVPHTGRFRAHDERTEAIYPVVEGSPRQRTRGCVILDS